MIYRTVRTVFVEYLGYERMYGDTVPEVVYLQGGFAFALFWNACIIWY